MSEVARRNKSERPVVRAKRSTVAPISKPAVRVLDGESAVGSTLRFLLEAIFASKVSKAETRIVRAMFHPQALIVLIPRMRPLYARAAMIDDFVDTHLREAVRSEKDWKEIERMEESWDSALDSEIEFTRVRSVVAIDPEGHGRFKRGAELLVVIGVGPSTPFIQSCTVLYDEQELYPQSPITLC